MPASRRQLLACALAAAMPSARASVAAPALPLLSVWVEGVDPACCLVSEKFDGVRGVWDGARLRFRSGRPVPAPTWFTARLPRRPLDGELWLGRGRFDELSALVRNETPNDTDWRAVRYLAFELPGATGSFAERAAHIAGIVRDAA
jgi:DNA ligase 1